MQVKQETKKNEPKESQEVMMKTFLKTLVKPGQRCRKPPKILLELVVL